MAKLGTKSSAIFTPDTVQFFKVLGRNNRKEWMDAHRDRYRSAVIEPFRALLNALAPVALSLDSDFDISGRTGANFSRINRDIRFSKDKTPYRTHMYLMFPGRPRDGWDGGQLYVGVTPEVVTAGFRIYFDFETKVPAPLVPPTELAKPKWILQQKRRLGSRYESYWYSMEKREWTKHPGWPVTADEWNKLKAWVVRRKLKPSALSRPGFTADVSKIFREVFPLYAFTCLPAATRRK
jgi:uncharacterized protein (TIGR02453 family)